MSLSSGVSDINRAKEIDEIASQLRATPRPMGPWPRKELEVTIAGNELTTGDLSYTELHAALRESEVTEACRLFPRGCRILELGGGNGLQAGLLARAGFEVISIDIPAIHAQSGQHFPVMEYDGRNIPFPDASFDGVFSSNVLEHISDLGQSLSELKRVLKTDGIGVHILPTPVWRFWTTLTHYPWLVCRALSKAASSTDIAGAENRPIIAASERSRWGRWRGALGLGLEPHGEFPNAFSELYHFRPKTWERVFRKNGFDVVSHKPSGLFYTGQLLFPTLTVSARRAIARITGSSCHIFVTRVAGQNR